MSAVMLPLSSKTSKVTLWRYALALVVGWTVLVGLLLAWNVWQIQKQTTIMALDEARDEFERGEALRRWATGHGGVYVPVTKDLQPSPYLVDIEDRDITLPSGKMLTLMNPSYMIRNYNESLDNKKHVVGHLTSLTITNPINAPDEWERDALMAFDTGKTEVYEFTEVNDVRSLRLMRPVVAEEKCLTCHKNNGYGSGDVAGGVTISIQMDRFEKIEWLSIRNELLVFSIFCLLGILGIGAGFRNVKQGISERNKALDALFEAESKWRSLMENTPDVIIIVNQLREVLYTNLKSEDWDVLTRGKGLKGFVDPDYHDLCNASVKKVFETGDTASYELKAKGLDDSTLWYLVRMGTINIDDEVVAASVIATDITSRKKTEERLRVSEGAYRSLFATHKRMVENSPAGIMLLDPDCRITYENPEMKKIFGAPYGEESLVLGVKITELPSVKETRLPDIIDSMKNGNKASAELPFKSIYGKEAFLSFNGVPMFDDGEFAGAVIMVADITDRMHFEDERAKLVAAVSQTEEAIVITDPDGSIEYVNKAFEKFTKYSQKEAIGKNPRILKSGEHDKEFYGNLWGTIKSGKVWKGRFHNRDKHGNAYIEDATITPVFNADNEIVNFVGVKRNVTKQLEFEQQVAQSQKMDAIGTLAGGIAHDFNNILSAIIGYTEMAAYSLDRDSEARECLDDALKASDRAKDLVKQILTFARYSEQKVAPVEPYLAVKESLKLLRSSIPSTIKIQDHIDTSSGYVLADPTQISQIMVNLCSNAEHAMRETGGVLDVSLQSVVIDDDLALLHDNLQVGEKYVQLTIIDTGHGMDKSTQTQIFEPFFTTKEKGEGTGLGLSVAYGLVNKMGGAIFAESVPDKKTTFTVYLPTTNPWETPAHTQVFAVTGSERILLVDDEPAIVKVETKGLSRLGYSITPFTSSVEALEKFKEAPDDFDLVITDQTMPTMTGAELVGEILDIRPDIPIILCTGFSQALTPERIEKLGIKKLVLKPVSPNDLAVIIREVMD